MAAAFLTVVCLRAGGQGAGVTGKFWIVHGEAQRKILYGEGEYNGWIIRRLGGRSIVMMTHRPERDGDVVVMKNQMIVFVKVDNVVVSSSSRLWTG